MKTVDSENVHTCETENVAEEDKYDYTEVNLEREELKDETEGTEYTEATTTRETS